MNFQSDQERRQYQMEQQEHTKRMPERVSQMMTRTNDSSQKRRRNKKEQ